jgi:lipopolysaccharide/colanic/teichoic acid biosynthesis glycosyltransferase/nucleoside-diphosphate-sugar epimerase
MLAAVDDTNRPAPEPKPKHRVLVVGATGFVGQAVCRSLLAAGMVVIAASRDAALLPAGVHHRALANLTEPQDWTPMLAGIESVVYLAARVHVMNDDHPDPLAAYRAVNTQAAVQLAEAAARAGVAQFIYLSSVKVNGEWTSRPLTEEDAPEPSDPYGQSKLEAEQRLLTVAGRTGLTVTILRPPLVYGPGVKANFLNLARLAGFGLPLPLGAVHNRRSMVYVLNLADAIRFFLEALPGRSDTYFVSDGQDLSVTELIRLLAQAKGRAARLVPVPQRWLVAAGRLVKREAVIQRLTSSLQVSAEKIFRLGWRPPHTPQQGVRATVQWLDAHRQTTTERDRQAPYQLTARQRLYLTLRGPVERLLAAGLLVVSAPLFGLLWSAVRLSSPGAAFFVQERAGRRHQPFRIYKFRTMRVGTPHLSTEEMRRLGLDLITPLGRFLRRSSLDELPQLINVLRGEMSFVGPRPALMTQTPVLTGRKMLGVDVLLPGITGLAQVTGRDDLDDREKVERDARYLRHLDLQTDALILATTIQSIFGGRGTY